MVPGLYVAAALLFAVGIAHSYLGERYILMRLFRRDALPPLFGGTDFTQRALRFVWHVLSIAWFGFAAILILIANDAATPQRIGLVVGVTFLVHFAISLFGGRGRHWSWIVFLAIGGLTLWATQT